MYEVGMSFVAGAAVGALFSVLNLPLPAPPVLSGVMGVVGVYAGGQAVIWFQSLG